MKNKGEKTSRGEKQRIKAFQVVENECIYMKAGIINFRICDNAYDCQTCPFELGMRKAMGGSPAERARQKTPAWVEHLKTQYNGASRPCRHVLTGRIEAPKICTLNYECYHCPFDQMLDELDVAPPVEAPSFRLVSGFRMADGYYYHLGHGWARFEHGGRVRVGLDDFVVKVFGPARTLKLPPLGAELRQNEVGWSLARNGHSGAVLSPVSGRVLAVNHNITEHPEIAEEDPYQQGWLFVIEPERPKMNLKNLYYGDDSARWMEQEGQQLMSLLGSEYEKLAATGGEVVRDVFGLFPDLGWDRLVETFLRTKGV